MAIGDRIRFIRNLRGLTQKMLGLKVGFSERTAYIRMAQYESGKRTPKEDMINKLAYVLEVSPDALTIPEIDSYIGLMHTLFAIEDLHCIKIDKISDEVCIRLDKSNLSKYIHMDDLLRSWYKEYEKYQNGEITKEEYDHWRYTYPKVKAECTKANLDKLREQNKNK